MMIKYGTNPPKRFPPTFSGGATFCRAISNGFTSVAGSDRSASRSDTARSRNSRKNLSSSPAASPDFNSPS